MVVPTGSNRLATEIIVGLTVAIISIALFLEIPIEWKVFGIIVLAVEGTIIFLVSVGWSNKIVLRIEEHSRSREIRKHPELIDELYRLGSRIREVLYVRSSEHASLIAQGEETMNSLYTKDRESWLPSEFHEKVQILQNSYNSIHDNLKQRRWKNYRWKTGEFADVLRSISTHLHMLNLVFETVYREAKLWPKEKPIPKPALSAWEAFRTEYNPTLQEWKSFTERFDTTIGYGTGTQAKPAGPLPVP